MANTIDPACATYLSTPNMGGDTILDTTLTSPQKGSKTVRSDKSATTK